MSGKERASEAIRDFRPEDYGVMAEIHNAAYPDYLRTAEHLEREDRLREDKHLWRRWAWEEARTVLAYGAYLQMSWEYHPRKFYIDVVVHPEARRRGIGTALYEHAVAAAAAHEPIALRSMVCEDCRRFAASRGYEDIMRLEESVLDFESFEPERFEADAARAEEQGIVIRTWPELACEANERPVYELVQQLLTDMPSRDPYDPPPFELWRERALESPKFLPELNLFALDGDRFIGISNFWRDESEGHVGTGLTGVISEYRRLGLATALKVRALAAAKAAGYKKTRTWNAAENAGMLGINRRLGFEPRPAWIFVEKVLDAAAVAVAEEAS